MDYFDAHSYHYSVRSTVTSKSIDKLDEFLDFLVNNTKCTQIHLEPISLVGRALDSHSDDEESLLKKFGEVFNKLRLNYLNRVQIKFSIYRIDQVKNTFCDAYGRLLNFCVSSTGNITSCYEVYSREDKRSKLFLYGYFDKKTKKFKINKKAVHYLQDLEVTKIPSFAKWNCGGGCLAKFALLGECNEKLNGTIKKCKLYREIILQEIYLTLMSNLIKEVSL
jgi:sulfatase maturation enzyme AslB (radical SAM superfamily)